MLGSRQNTIWIDLANSKKACLSRNNENQVIFQKPARDRPQCDAAVFYAKSGCLVSFRAKRPPTKISLKSPQESLYAGLKRIFWGWRQHLDRPATEKASGPQATDMAGLNQGEGGPQGRVAAGIIGFEQRGKKANGP
jgi:hypothetical protein